ncbi:hypothetical protein [Caldilinea sp.]|uniref:hypothetical protein n=1 Tax=Caldilinea sp. TaxID=2293560 RepID=UPI002611C2BC|nr:hypothetical protein [Caldilinea sp.]
MTGSLSFHKKRIAAFCTFAIALALAPISSYAQPGYEPHARVLYVDAQTGNDSGNNCLNPTAPCRTLQHAVNQANSGDTILVAAGVYTHTGVDNPCERYLGGQKAVVCIVNKQVKLRGGYANGDWSLANPAANLTVIDGENRVRGVWVQGTEPKNPLAAGVEMEGFTIRRGYIQGTPSGGDAQTFAFGGGMLTDRATVVLRNLRFENNVAKGGGAQNEYGGSASGGGLAIRTAPTRAQLERLVFVHNRAEGGSGRVRGGYALGAGLYILWSGAEGSALEFYDNVSQAGSTSGNGRTSDSQTADAFGAGATIMGYADVTLWNITAQRNRSIGGNAAVNAGGAFGGAIKIEGAPGEDFNGDGVYETATVRIIGCRLSDNLAQGGDAANGGMSAGGAIETIHSTLWLEGCKILNNTSQGGNGSNAQGPAGGGGLYLQNIFYGEPTATVKNSVIAFNKVAAGQGSAMGGGGGGVWLQGVTATLRHNTIVGNRMLTNPLQGAAILVMSDGATGGPKPADIRYNIIANHADAGFAALHVKPSNTANLSNNLFFGNAGNINTSQVGSINGMETSILQDPLFLNDPTGENPFRIPATSPAVDRAKGSDETTDVENSPRHGVPDIGAYEAAPFRLTAFPTASNSVRVHWGAQIGVSSYQMTVRCPPSANPPDGFACNQPVRLKGDADGALLTGLTNYAAYTVLVSGLDGNGNVILSAETTAFATDLFVYAPLISR